MRVLRVLGVAVVMLGAAAVVSSQEQQVPRERAARLVVVHNIGWGPQLEDVLFAYPISGHYR